MSTNRMKIDWAYRAAEKHCLRFHPGRPTQQQVRALAQLLRNHYRRGMNSYSRGQPVSKISDFMSRHSVSAEAFQEAIRIVRRFKPANCDWEIRYWVVKDKLIESLQRKLRASLDAGPCPEKEGK